MYFTYKDWKFNGHIFYGNNTLKCIEISNNKSEKATKGNTLTR